MVRQSPLLPLLSRELKIMIIRQSPLLKLLSRKLQIRIRNPGDPTQLQLGGDDLKSVTENTKHHEDGDLHSASPPRSLSPARMPLQLSKSITPVSHDHQKNGPTMLSSILTKHSSTSGVSPNYTQGIQ